MDSNTQKVGVLITTVADDGGIKTTQAELTVLGDTAKKTSATATSAFDSFTNSLKGVGTQMSAVGRDMTSYITLPVVGVGAAATKMAIDFQQSMTYVRTDAGDTTDNINTLSDSVLNLAKTSQFSPDVLANGLYHLASLGLRGADAMNALNTAQQMASVGGSDLESTASALGGALVSGIKGVQDYTSAAGVLDATIGAGNMRMQDLVNAIGTGVLPVFKNAGLSITDFGAALATLTDNGQDASAAATHLRMTIALMEAPSQAATKALNDIGISQHQLGMDMQTKGLIPALQDLQKHLLDTYGTTAKGKTEMAAALNEMFGGGKSSAAIQTLLDQLDRVQNKETQIGQQSGEFATKYAEQQQTASAQLKTSWDGIQANLIQLGDVIMPTVAHAMKDVSEAIGEVSGWFQSLSKGQQQFVIDSAAVLAATGPILLVFGTMAKSIASILDLGKTLGEGIGMAVDGVGSLFGMLSGVGKGVGGAASSFGSMASGWASSIADMAKATASGAADMARSAGTAVASWASAGAKMAADFAVNAASMAKNAVVAAGAWIKAAHDSEIGVGGTLIKMAKDSVVSAATAAAAWVSNFAIVTASAVKNAALSSAAWVTGAARSSAAWVTQELPRIVAEFAATSAAAVKNAVIASASWVREAAVASAAWVVQLARVAASTVATAVVTVAQGAIIGAVWVAQTIKAGVYAVAVDGAKTSTYLLGAATGSVGIAMAGVFAGLVVDIGLVYKAIQTVIGAYSAVQQANAAAKADSASISAAHQQIVALSKNGTADQKARANKLLSEGYSNGGYTGSGGVNEVAGVVHKGEYVLPQSQVDQRTGQPKSGGNTTQNTFTGNIILGSAGAANEFFKNLNNDGMLALKGMTVRQGH